jgi:hypothetical protein
VHREGVAGQHAAHVPVAYQRGEGGAAPGVHRHGAGDHDYPAAAPLQPDQLVGHPAHGHGHAALRRDVARHEAELLALGFAEDRPDAHGPVGADHGIAAPHVADQAATRPFEAGHDDAVHAHVRHFVPRPVEENVGAPVGGGVELVGHAGVGGRGLEARFTRRPVPQPEVDQARGERLQGGRRVRAHLQLDRGLVDPGAAHDERHDLVVAAGLEHDVQRPGHQARVDEVPRCGEPSRGGAHAAS